MMRAVYIFDFKCDPKIYGLEVEATVPKADEIPIPIPLI